MNNIKKRKIATTALIIVAIVLATAGIAFGWLSVHYKSLIKKQLPVWVAKASDSLYQVSVTDISINLIRNKVTITGARLWPDSNRLRTLVAEGREPNTVFTMDVPAIQADGVVWGAVMSSKELSCDLFYISEPKIVITTLPHDTTIVRQERRRATIERITSNHIEIYHPDVTYHNQSGADTTTYYLKGGDIVLNNWLFDPQSKDFQQKTIYGELGNLELDSFSYATSTGLYSVSCGHTLVNTGTKQTTINNFRLKPLYEKHEFYEKVGHQKEIYNIHFPKVAIQGFDPELLINKETLVASAIQLTDPAIDIYYSRIPPSGNISKVGHFPNQLVQHFGFKTFVKTVQINNGHFSYTEKNAYTLREGSFTIEAINGSANHISNMPEQLQADHNSTIQLQGKFMGKSTMKATFLLDLTDTLGGFSVTGEQTNLDAEDVHDMVKALALADLQSMHISSIKFSVKGNQDGADGSMIMLYSGLKVALLKVNDEKEMKKLSLVSFIANAALIYNANPEPDKEVRTASMHEDRNPMGSFFNLIWKTLFQGITETALSTQGAADMVQEADPGDKHKKGFFQKLKQVFKKKDKK